MESRVLENPLAASRIGGLHFDSPRRSLGVLRIETGKAEDKLARLAKRCVCSPLWNVVIALSSFALSLMVVSHVFHSWPFV